MIPQNFLKISLNKLLIAIYISDGDTSCSSSNISVVAAGTTSRNSGWWGPKGTDILNIKDCYIKDTPPGLISVQYRFPVNWSQPDDVNVICYHLYCIFL